MTTITVNLPQLYELQHQAFFNDARIAICEATTKGGKTVGAITWQADQVLSDTLKLNHWWVAPYHKQAEIAYTRAKRMFAGVYESANDSKKRLIYRNGAVWWFMSAEKPDTLYGEDVGSAVGDEFTRMRVEANDALLSTLTATEGKLRYIGNVKGRRWGYHMARRAEAGGDSMRYTKITADDAIAAGVIKRETVEFARTQMRSYKAFRELFYCEPDDDAGNPFGMEAIDECIKPRSTKETAVYGIDLGRAVDWTVVTGLDRDGDWTEGYRFQGDWREQKRKLAEIIGTRKALVDDTGNGNPIVADLQAVCPRVEGFTFTPQSKQHLMERLQTSIQHRSIGVPNGERFKEWASELRTFEYVITRTGVKYSAPEESEMHDDCVCSLALANWALGDLPRMVSKVEVVRRVSDNPWARGQQQSGSPLMGREATL